MQREVKIEKPKENPQPDVAIAIKFINGYVENANKMSKAEGIVEWVNSSDLATPKLKNELKRIIEEAEAKDPEMGLDFDPVFDAQDYPESFELAYIDAKIGYLAVRRKNSPSFMLTMKLINENNKWLVDGSGVVNIPKEKRAQR